MVKGFETSSAALAALCIAGVSSHANASTLAIPLDYNTGQSIDIAIDSTTPQFNYDSTKYLGYVATFSTLNSGGFAPSGVNGVNAIDSSLTYSPSPPGGLGVAYKGETGSPFYVQLAFYNSDHQEEFGYASFDNVGDLASITCSECNSDETFVVTPLPSTWLPFISGLGALGFAAAQRRRRRISPMPA
jgi:hypothetical protein